MQCQKKHLNANRETTRSSLRSTYAALEDAAAFPVPACAGAFARVACCGIPLELGLGGLALGLGVVSKGDVGVGAMFAKAFGTTNAGIGMLG